MQRRHRSLLAVAPLVLLVVVLATAPTRDFHLHLSLAGEPHRFAAVVADAGRSDARAALALDTVFVAAWLAVVPRLLRIGIAEWAPERRRIFGWWRHAPAVAIAAGVLDLAANALSVGAVGDATPPRPATLAIATLAWAELLAYAVAFVGFLGLVVAPLLAPAARAVAATLFAPFDRLAGRPVTTSAAPTDAIPAQQPQPRDRTDRIGICLSGGGIRAASVAVGALRSLDRPPSDGGRSLFRRARWLAAVSGGGYAAGGWRVSRRPGVALPPGPHDDHDGLFAAGHPWARSVASRHRFLANGAGSLLGGVLGAALRSVAVLGAVFAAAHIVGWGVGEVVRSWAVHPRFPIDEGGQRALELGDLVRARLIVPWLVPAAVAALAVLGMAARRDRAAQARLRSVAVVALAVAATVAVLTTVAPLGIYAMPGLLRRIVAPSGGGDPDEGAGILGLLSALGIVGALVATLRAQLKRRWMRLGGVLLGVVVLLYAGKVADSLARGRGGWTRSLDLGATVPTVIVAIVWIVAVDSIASHRLTLGGVYRKRLAATFALDAGDAVPLPAVPYASEPEWAAYRAAQGPELIVCATAHATGRRFTGLTAYGFTFRPSGVTLYDVPDGAAATVPIERYPKGSWWMGYPRGWIVTRSMALAGAAFASAMGRQALGTTNALLAALNLRLGAWVPNPRHIEWFSDPSTRPRVHVGYLAKEIVGWYRPESDPFVYVADGGHRDNLGLVELLRERPDTVVSVDASGDAPGTFRALKDAIDLARIELGVDVDVDYGPIDLPERGVPLDCVTTGRITYPAAMGGGTGRLFYGRYQVSEQAPAAVAQFAAANLRYPYYSTGDQFLTDDEHRALVALGQHVGDRLAMLWAATAASGPTP